MTTTAHEDQFTAGTQTIQPVLQPYSTEAILRRNIADAEKEMQRQAERAESYAETLRSIASYVGAGGYNADTVDAGVFEEKIRWGIGELIGMLDRANAELAKLAQQEPIKYLYRVIDCFGRDVLRDDPRDATIIETIPLYAVPVPANQPQSGVLAVPDWNVNIERIRDVMHMLGISIEESVECFSAALPTNINRMTLAMKRHLQELAGMTAVPAVPDEWKRAVADFLSSHDAAWAEPFKSLPANVRSVSVSEHQADAVRAANVLRALLQSAEVTNAAADRLLEGGE